MKIAMIITRDINAPVSRSKTMKGIHDSLASRHEVTTIAMKSAIESRSFSSMLFLSFYVIGILIGVRKPEPIQSLIYQDRHSLKDIFNRLNQENYDIIYFDTVRLISLIRLCAKLDKKTRLIVDFDDLFSRRAQSILKIGRSFSLGVFASRLPEWMNSLVRIHYVGRAITLYEQHALAKVEVEATGLADEIVLVSSYEAELLRARVSPEQRQKIHGILPPMHEWHFPSEGPSGRLRFAFFGPDSQLQNETAIFNLIEKWAQLKPGYELHIYGRQKKKYPGEDNVIFHGFVEDIAEVYSAGTIILAPFLFPGGIKTKVLESWMYGSPTITTPEGLEGLDCPDYPLALPLENWDAFITAPQAHADIFRSAQLIGKAFIREHADSLEREWLDLVSREEIPQGVSVQAAPAIAKGSETAKQDRPRPEKIRYLQGNY